MLAEYSAFGRIGNFQLMITALARGSAVGLCCRQRRDVTKSQSLVCTTHMNDKGSANSSELSPRRG